MKVTKLIIKNVGLIEDTTLELNKPLILFFGEIRQGKTTILNAIRWVLGMAWPEDIIRHGADEASVSLEFDGGSVGRSWYRSKTGKNKGATVARETTFVKAGRRVERPAAEITRMLNPFLLDHEYLKRMTEGERRQYFVDTFPVDTKDLDTEAFNIEKEATDLRAEIRGFGAIDLTPVPEVNAANLRGKVVDARKAHGEKLTGINREIEDLQTVWQDECKEVDLANDTSRDQNTRHNNLRSEIIRLETQIKSLQDERDLKEHELERTPLLTYKPRPDQPPRLTELRQQVRDWDTSSAEIEQLERDAEEGARKEQRYKEFVDNQTRAKLKEGKEERVRQIEGRLRGIKSERVTRLAKCAEVIPGLSFNELGEFTFEGTAAGMLSTSQVMRLSESLSAMYPEGFGLSLIDRAESLGKSIFEFVERAKDQSKTILATIVGEAPARAPAEVGVFVVEDGRVTKKQTDLL